MATINAVVTAAARATVRATEITKQGRGMVEKVSEVILEASKQLPESATHLGNALSAGAAHLPKTSQNLKEAARALAHSGVIATATAVKYGLDAVQGADVVGHHAVQAVAALEPSVARVENMTLSLPLLAYRVVKSGTLVIGGGFVAKKGIDLIVDGFKKYYNSNSDAEKRQRIRTEGLYLMKAGTAVTVLGAFGMYIGKPTIQLASPVIARPVVPPVVPSVAPA